MATLRGNHYEVLCIGPRATSQQVEKAYRFSLEMYSDQALATYSLLDAEEVREARVRLQEAYEVLRDPARRLEYDVSLGFAAPGAPVLPFFASVAQPSRAPTEAARRADVSVLPETVTGSDLRRCREENGISLRDIATTTKIGVRFLEYIEADRIADLPAAVYLRGFLQEYARAVGLDPRKTADAYMARLEKQD